jgi:hypothetical protein
MNDDVRQKNFLTITQYNRGSETHSRQSQQHPINEDKQECKDTNDLKETSELFHNLGGRIVSRTKSNSPFSPKGSVVIAPS